MELILLCACMIGPAPLVDLLSALLQRGERPAFLTRWRCFILGGASRARATFWMVRGR
jgi:hypothetical protein